MWIGREVSSPALARREQLARERKIPIEHALRGKSFGWMASKATSCCRRLFPKKPLLLQRTTISQVRRLRYGSQTLLLPGAARKRGGTRKFFRERERSAEEMHSDVLKIGNHGSKNSTTPAFLAAVRPRSESYPLVRSILTDIPARSSRTIGECGHTNL